MFVKPTLTGYNATPPPDDGSNTEANEITWLKHIGKIGDPLRNYADAINEEINTAVDLLEHPPINNQTASYTLVLTDDQKLIEMEVGTANNLTVPPHSSVAFATGAIILVNQKGAGATTIVEGSGVTVNTPSTLVINAQYDTVGLLKTGANEWLLTGGFA